MGRDVWESKNGRGEIFFSNGTRSVAFARTRDRKRMSIAYETSTKKYDWVDLDRKQTAGLGAFLLNESKGMGE